MILTLVHISNDCCTQMCYLYIPVIIVKGYFDLTVPETQYLPWISK